MFFYLQKNEKRKWYISVVLRCVGVFVYLSACSGCLFVCFVLFCFVFKKKNWGGVWGGITTSTRISVQLSS